MTQLNELGVVGSEAPTRPPRAPTNGQGNVLIIADISLVVLA